MFDHILGAGFVHLRVDLGHTGIGDDDVKGGDVVFGLEFRNGLICVGFGETVDFDDDETAAGTFGEVC